MELTRQQLVQLDEDTLAQRKRRYLQAGIAYILAALLSIPITLLVPNLIPAEQISNVRFLWYAIPFVALIGVYIARGDRFNAWMFELLGVTEPRRGRLSRWIQDGLALLLALSGTIRTIIFISSVFGQHIDIHPPVPSLGRGFELHIHPGEPKPIFLLNALLTGIYALLLIRAAWQPAPDR